VTNGVVLLVTWLIFGQAPQSYQHEFSSQQACDAARVQVLQEGERLKAETRQQDTARAAQPGVLYAAPSVPPMVTAICAPN
jgi:hypothetical protein